MKNKEIKILLVDDEPDILEIVGYNLKNEGYKIYTAKNGIEAIEIAKLFCSDHGYKYVNGVLDKVVKAQQAAI